MIVKPEIHASKKELLQFVHHWVKLCATGDIDSAFDLLDPPVNTKQHVWTQDDFHEVTFDHFSDGQYPSVTDPDKAEGTIRTDVFEYDDRSGWGVAYDLSLNNVVSDFTLMFDFIKIDDQLKVLLTDCHVSQKRRACL